MVHLLEGGHADGDDGGARRVRNDVLQGLEVVVRDVGHLDGVAMEGLGSGV